MVNEDQNLSTPLSATISVGLVHMERQGQGVLYFISGRDLCQQTKPVDFRSFLACLS